MKPSDSSKILQTYFPYLEKKQIYQFDILKELYIGESGSALRFEAAVAGGIPVIKSLTEGLAGNSISKIMGVMNGTCNYILTRMESSGLSYEEVFSEADDLGYLEADPNLDIGGIDAAHKLSLLSSIACT